MALTGDGGLDAQVEQRMDAYRGNPQQLQKRYGKNKELLDLLALQKLTTEKKQIAAAMQLEQEQQPGTIAEQREAEAIGLVKQEMGGTLGELQARTGDTLGQQAKMQKKGMNKMAEGAGRPPQAGGIAGLMGGGGRPPQARPPMPPPGGPQAAGLPNARMMQAARGGPVRRMAGGGIVGFAGDDGNNQVKTKTLTLEQKAALQNKFGGNANRYINLIESGRLTNLVANQETRDLIATTIGETPVAQDQRQVDPLSLANPKKLGMDTGAPLGMPPGGISELMPPPPAPSEARTGLTGVTNDPFAPAKTTPFVGPDMEVTETDAPAAEIVEEPAFKASDGSNAPQVAAADKPDLVGGQDPMAQMQAGFAAANEETGRFDKAAEYDSMLAEMKVFDEENYDPERERNDRLKTFLMGAAGTTNIGTTFAQAGAASMNLGSKQRVDRRSRLIDKFDMQKSKMATDAALAQTSVGLGKELFSQATQDNRAAMQAGVAMRAQDLTRLSKNAQLKLDTMKNEDTNAWKKLSADHEQNKLDAQIINDTRARKIDRIAAANATIARTLLARENFAKQAASTMNLEGLRLALENAEFMKSTPEEIKAAQLAYDTAAAEALVLGESMLNSFGRGGTKENQTGASMLDAEQLAIKILSGYGLGEDGEALIDEKNVKSVTTTGN